MNQPPLAIGIGIHTGPLVAGYVGSSKALSYTVIGDTANTSARLCGIALDGADRRERDTLTRLGNRFEFEELARRTLKGKEKPSRIFNVLAREASSRHRQGHGVDTGRRRMRRVRPSRSRNPSSSSSRGCASCVSSPRRTARSSRSCGASRTRRRALARELFADLDAVAEGPALAAPEPPVHARLRRVASSPTGQELHGDRRFGDDAGDRRRPRDATRGGASSSSGIRRGARTKEKVTRNFGQAHPEGYRKAVPAVRARRSLRPAGPHVHRHAGRVPRHRRRRARAERSDRRVPRGDGAGARADRRDDHRRRGQRRRARPRRREPRARPRVRHVQRHLARRAAPSILWKDGAKADEAAARMR